MKYFGNVPLKVLIPSLTFFPKKIHKQEQLLSRLQTLVWGDEAQPQVTCEVLDYFLQRLSSQQPSSGQLASKVGTIKCVCGVEERMSPHP